VGKQNPDEQTSVPEHAWPHEPQLAGSLSRCTHTPPHWISEGSGSPVCGLMQTTGVPPSMPPATQWPSVEQGRPPEHGAVPEQSAVHVPLEQ
jgi:hypothetical protein